jgi:UDP-N-acetylmuramoyl-L-alanyl-D-glutamate--2,6-diaminopimelate ligase
MRRSAHEPALSPALPRDPVLAGLTLDSRKVRPGYLFAALPGAHHDGAAFVADAVGRGAAAILAAPDAALPVLDSGIVVLRDANPRRRVALMAAAFAGGQPATVAAVTGTNGKSSTVHFVRQIWATLGFRAASVGTLGIVSPGLTREGGLTTPDPVQLHQDLPCPRGRRPSGDRGVESRSRSAPPRRRPAVSCGFHQSHARASRLSFVHGRLLRGQGPAV